MGQVYQKGKNLLDGVKDPNFGVKYIGVRPGATLEIHGADKLSWTRLASTLVPHPPVFEIPVGDESNQPATDGIMIMEMDRQTGLHVSTKVVRSHDDLNNALSALNAKDEYVALIANRSAI